MLRIRALFPARRQAQLDCGWRTDAGPVRTRNEDAVLPATIVATEAAPALLTAVADGVGGMRDGDLASDAVVRTIEASFVRAYTGNADEALVRVVQACDAAVRELNQGRDESERMASTLVAAAVVDGAVHIVHVGDSRAYLLRGRKLRQMTRDHSLVEDSVAMGAMTSDEATRSPLRNVLTRGVGTADATPDLATPLRLRAGDIVLLSSDGVHGALSAEELVLCLDTDMHAQGIADALVDAALAHGTMDNATAVVLRAIDAQEVA